MKKFIVTLVIAVVTIGAGSLAQAAETNQYFTLEADASSTVTNEDNGSVGGYALVRVTDEQWDVLRKAGVKPQIFGNVVDIKHPREHTPILMDKGFGEEVILVTYPGDQPGTTKQGLLPKDAPRPKVFWVAVATWQESKGAKN